ncbi:S-type pyocin domain-containing protein [Pseudomonas wadenswilerensis]
MQARPATGLADNAAPPPEMPGKPARIGGFHSMPAPRLEPFEVLQDVRFNDYVLVFPTASGVPPMYVMLRESGPFPG